MKIIFILLCQWMIYLTGVSTANSMYFKAQYRSRNKEGNNTPTIHVPLIPDGEKKFQFFALTSSGTLVKRWLTLQRIQDIILKNGISTEIIQDKSPNSYNFPSTRQQVRPSDTKNVVSPISLNISLRRNESNVEDVIANIQKVMSEKINNSEANENQAATGTANMTDSLNKVVNAVAIPYTDENVKLDQDAEIENYAFKTTLDMEDTDNSFIKDIHQQLQSNSSELYDTPLSPSFDTHNHPIDVKTNPVKEDKENDKNKMELYMKDEHMESNKISIENIKNNEPPQFDNNNKNISWIFISSSHASYEDQLANSSTNTVGNSEKINCSKSKADIINNNLSNVVAKLGKIGSNSAVITIQTSPTVATNVLPPSQISDASKPQIHILEDAGGNQEHAVDDYVDTLYLEDLPEVNYDYSATNVKNATAESLELDFPGPDVAISYFQPDHIQNQSSVFESPNKVKAQTSIHSSSSQVDPTHFLPQFNPEIAKGANPLRPTPAGNLGMEKTTLHLNKDMRAFIDTMNHISFEVYKRTAKIHRRQNVIMSTLNLISALTMLRLGARNNTADSLSKVLKLEEFSSFNPHQMMRNITAASLSLNNFDQEIAFVNNIFIEKPQSPYSLDFIRRMLKFFYNARIEQVPIEAMGAAARDRANDEIRRQTNRRMFNFLKPKANLIVNGPMSVVSSAFFQGKWALIVDETDLFDMNFIRFPSAERRLIKTVGITKKMKINAGYSPDMDATVAEIPLLSELNEFSLILVMPGRQKNFVANGLSHLEQFLTVSTWSKLLRSVIPHNLILKMPVFSHRNYLNLSQTLSDIGLSDLFKNEADFSGFNGLKDLFVGDVAQLNEFHSIKIKSSLRKKRSLYRLYTRRRFQKDHNEEAYLPKEDNNNSNSRYSSSNYSPVLAYDRAFFYVLRHNPSGLILFMGRYLDPESF